MRVESSKMKNSNKNFLLMLLLILVIFTGHLCTCINSIHVQSSSNDPLVINTDAGKVEGISIPYYESSSSSSSSGGEAADDEVKMINTWLSIPFAQPPIDSLRWKDSAPVQSWEGTLPCKTIKPSCIPADTVDGYSEDCLYLNVYTLDDPIDEGPYPVLFYIYGGALLFGSATENMTSFIAHAGRGKGMVVVEVNYRLNVFGFLAVKELSREQGGHSGNYGFSDQLLALEWVQRNIAQFGGDPNRVTIAGQSSGGTSVFALMSSPRSKSLFHRAISLSGSPNISMSLSQAEVQNADIVVKSGCTNGSSNFNETTSILSCMRGLSPEVLVSLVPSSWWTPGLWNLPKSEKGQNYAGLAIVDGKTITKPFDVAVPSGLIDIPLMLGNMQFEPDEHPEQDVSVLSDEEWHSKLISSFSTYSNDSAVAASIAEEIYKRYLPFSQENPQKAYDAFVSDYGVYCPSIDLAKKFKSPTKSIFQSDLYIYVNKWNLSSAIVNEQMYSARYAFHYLDFIMIKEDWNLYSYIAATNKNVSEGAEEATKIIGNARGRRRNNDVGVSAGVGESSTKFVPQESDLRGSQFLQSVWFDFMSTGSVSASTGGAWRPVGSNTHWPRSFEMFVIDPDISEAVIDYRADFCQYIASIGMNDPNFWWVN